MNAASTIRTALSLSPRTAGLAALLGALGAASGCSGGDLGQDVGFEKWNDANNPAFVDENFEYDVAKLPLSGKAARPPIPADYWGTYNDNINAKWDGDESLSPTAKFGKAFGKEGIEDTISGAYGIDHYRGMRKSCDADYDCNDLKDGSSCARRNDKEEKGVCIPTWWGICHGWAPYAISEPAAVKPIEYNGVKFYPGDIEGLFSLVYTRSLPVKFLSERCNEERPKVEGDGRIPQDECRDMNPGTLHIVATNLLGIRQQGYVEDRTYDLQVWNQPVSAFRVTNGTEDGKLREITKEEAVKLVGLPEGSAYTYNPEAKRFFHVQLEIDWIGEAGPAQYSHVGDNSYTRTDSYEYVLETDAKGKIFGGEYVGGSRELHPDFVWWPTGRPTGSVAGGITYDQVKMLNDMAAKAE
ncbi:MAG: hypothetical protein HY744_21665 [Deltaproteobacteria bacterium]|nr:hypothetical protein [Deltaproteobacteria bacterium]